MSFRASHKQIVRSAPEKVIVERYLTKSGKRKMQELGLSEKKALKVLGKNRKAVNPDSKPIKVIEHD